MKKTEHGYVSATMLGGPIDGGTIAVSDDDVSDMSFGIGVRSECGNGWIHHYSRVRESSDCAPVYRHSFVYRDAQT